MFNNSFFPENRAVYVMRKKYCTAEQATDKAHAHCMLDT